MENKITLVITSANRLDLLRKTIYSFMHFNSYPISNYIIIDDSGNHECHDALRNEFGAIFQVICNPERIGQIKSIDIAYSHVKTEYVFHCEDDWQFYRSGFIEISLKLLAHDPKIIQVWLREQNDTNGHPIEPLIYSVLGTRYQRMSLNYLGYQGFTLNPGLKRMSDYNLIKPYSKVEINKDEHPSKKAKFYTPEVEIGRFYADRGFRAVILQEGYVKHIGWGHTISREK